MFSSLFSMLGRALAWSWRALDFTRRALVNLLLLAALAALLWSALSSAPPLPERTTLVLAPEGPIREQYGASLRRGALDALGSRAQETRLRDVLAALNAAAGDPKIERLLVVTDEFAGAGLATLREVAAAIDRFKAAGKQVVAWGSDFDQRQYFLAAHASEVWLHPMGSVQITGYGGYRTYLKNTLDKLGVTAHVLRVGEYKNAAEQYTAAAPSKETLESEKTLYDALWAEYAASVEKARQLPAGALQKSIDEAPALLAAAGGDTAKMALDTKLVDALKTRDEMRALLVERGVKDGKSFRQIHFQDYAARVESPARGDAVGVVVAEGSIVDGDAPSGTIGGLSTAELIRNARDDDRIKAVVLRVDSPGGSAFGSELVRRELELTRAAGKPVVVSMGDVAASGGYWISLAADEVIADPATITGSIGVVAMIPTFEGAAAKVGLGNGGYATSWMVGAYDPVRGLDPRYAALIQSAIDHTYVEFTTRAAAARKTTREAIDQVGRGRVWTGKQALERGLVDRMGSFQDAIEAAADRAAIDGEPAVIYLDRQPGTADRLLGWLSRQLGVMGVSLSLGDGAAGGLERVLPPALLRQLRDDAGWLAEAMAGDKPFKAMAHCLCTAP